MSDIIQVTRNTTIELCSWSNILWGEARPKYVYKFPCGFWL